MAAYGTHYSRLIERARVRVLSGYVERHHIVPRCMGGGDEPENIVRLTPEEHFVAHQLLVKMHPECPQLIWAAHLMASRPGNKLYGWMRRRMSEARKGRKPSPEHIAKIQAARKGWKPTPEHAARVSAALKGVPKSPAHRSAIAAAARVRGISAACRAAATVAAKRQRGPYSLERRAAISAAKFGQSHSEEARAKMSASHKGRQLTLEHRQAISAAALGKKRGPYKKRSAA